ncbi:MULTISPECIES: UbiA family prenyltransferase [Achromobacter]|uniref:UbiA family prenyltransferase n=1 Tax=Achromobacter spanius TaxID=217203 RepID=A0ABY8H041_9BURK|nr:MULTISPECIES: UbiA family prenyltransferase [Achromobacter]WAI85767.1 UbiA family prenyltransferase [Achromobacter spanius]WEX95848.1 UbiA family prenyltransferase [Achromobacter sp. SS2-2022]WFP10431.1 UbiA family prenyltransferase [Achromobacter spanius]
MSQPPSSRPQGGIDPAALIVASVALLGTTMLGAGSFSILSSVLGLTIIVVIYAYDEHCKRTFPQQAGFAMVIGFAATVALGAPAELINLLPTPQECLDKTDQKCIDYVEGISEQINSTLFFMWIASTLFVLACETERGRHIPVQKVA